jgi:uncharacterized protein YndB with AHSA1/START domain
MMTLVVKNNPSPQGGTMTKTDILIPGDEPVIVMTRIFEASRALVWQAISRPEHFARWWGPRRMINEIVEMDIRAGGKWRIRQRDGKDGPAFEFWGEYLEIIPPEKSVSTQHFLDYPPILVSIRLEDLGDGRTRMSAEQRLDSMASREVLLASGMTGGATESYDRLEELLTTLAGG